MNFKDLNINNNDLTDDINKKIKGLVSEDKALDEQERHELFMSIALFEARKAYRNGDVPIGAVIVYDGYEKGSKMAELANMRGIKPGEIIGIGYNRRNMDASSLKHAEISAIEEACRRFGDWRLEDCSIYVSLEPCPMCAGAIVQARIKRLVLGAMNPKAGCCGSIINLMEMKELNHQVSIVDNILKDECAMMMKEFFKAIRDKKKKEK